MTYLSDIDLQQFRSGIGTIMMKTNCFCSTLVNYIIIDFN
jgi:hypothetical protein